MKGCPFIPTHFKAANWPILLLKGGQTRYARALSVCACAQVLFFTVAFSFALMAKRSAAAFLSWQLEASNANGALEHNKTESLLATHCVHA
jgi:hypothetical protein